MDLSKLDDASLWSRTQQDDPAAYEAIYNKYIGLVYSSIIKHVGTKQDSEDIAHDIFLTIWEKRGTIKLEGKLFSYIYSITRYKVLKYLKDKQLLAQHATAWKEWLTEAAGEELILTEDIDPIEKQLQKVLDLAQELPAQMRAVYKMNLEQDMRAAEIADQLGIAETTVRKHLVRIKKKLRGAAMHFFQFIL